MTFSSIPRDSDTISPFGDSPPAVQPDCGKNVWHGVVCYDGTRFHGWQIQPEVATIQGEITSRLRCIFDCKDLRISGTSRTDAGVHALEQHFSFPDPAPGRFTAERLQFTLRRWLPPSILLRDMTLEEPTFHARHRAKAKAYSYAVCQAEAPSPFEAPYVWHCTHAVNADAIRKAARELVGRHDFTSLSATSKQEVEDPVKMLHRLDVITRGNYLYFNVVGDSFLYKMVRSIVGYLVLCVGRDPEWTPSALRRMLETAARDPEVQTAPPQGLFLSKVFFADGSWQDYSPQIPPQETTGPVTVGQE